MRLYVHTSDSFSYLPKLPLALFGNTRIAAVCVWTHTSIEAIIKTTSGLQDAILKTQTKQVM